VHRYSRFHYYGAVFVGPHGQIQIPAEARRVLGVVAGEKMIVLDREGHLVLAKAKVVGEYVSEAIRDLAELQRQLRSDGEAAEAPDSAATVDEEGAE